MSALQIVFLKVSKFICPFTMAITTRGKVHELKTGGGQDEQENVFVCSANRINQSFQMFLSFRYDHCGKRQGACSKERDKEGRKC